MNLAARLTPNWLTGHRAVLVALIALAAVAFGVSSIASEAQFPYRPSELAILLLLSVIATGASSYALAAVVRVPPGADSWLITALILFFLMPGVTGAASAVSVIVAGVGASASKYVLVWRRRLIVNPAVAGAVLAYGLSYAGVQVGETRLSSPFWWVAAESLFWPMLIIGVLLVTVLREWWLVTAFLAASLATIGVMQVLDGGQDLKIWFVSTPTVFLAAIMLPEPLTSPNTRGHRAIYGAIVGVLMFCQQRIPITDSFAIEFIPQNALLVGCLYAFAVRLIAQRGAGRELLAVTTTAIATDTYRISAASDSGGSHFVPGQWALLSAPRWSAPLWQRTRRVLSYASAPGQPAEFGFTVTGEPSTFKGDLIAGRTTDLRVDAVGGDFTLPSGRGGHGGRGPVFLIASGIGITPYRSKLATLTSDAGADLSWLRVIHVVKATQRRVYDDVLDAARAAGATVTVISAADLAVGKATEGQWRDILGDPQPGGRYFLSGNPDFVSETASELRQLDTSLRWQRWRIHTDAFFGY